MFKFESLQSHERRAHLVGSVVTQGRVTTCNNLLEFVKICSCKPIWAEWTSRCCFEHYERVQTTAKALWHEEVWRM